VSIGAVTTSTKEVVFTTDPAVAVTVIVLDPTAADALARRVKVDEQVGLQVAALKDAVTPAGIPEALKVTGVVDPLTRVATTVFAFDSPCASDMVPPLLNAKSNGVGGVVVAFEVSE
jgi:hypothetical protein